MEASSHLMTDRRSLAPPLIRDGRPLIVLTALALLFSGGFALFLSVVQQFLPHDLDYLKMTARELCSLGNCRVVAFMVHDRATFGGVLAAIGTLYLWLAEFPLRRGERWAWWVLTLSGITGFASFLGYLGYGYLDTWHGTATLLLLPIFIGGLVLSFGRLRRGGKHRTFAPSWSPVSDSLKRRRAMRVVNRSRFQSTNAFASGCVRSSSVSR